MVYIIQSAILNQHLSSSKKKNIKTVNKKNSQVTASLYTKKFTSSSIWPLPQTNAHLSLQSTIAWTNITARALQKAEKLLQIGTH